MIVDKRWPIAQTGGGFGISALMQELMCYLGQNRVFEDASELLRRMTGLRVSAKQIERVCHYYGQALEGLQQREEYKSPLEKELSRQRAQDGSQMYYILADGSMVFTREEQWKEVKLGRIFRGDKRVDRVGMNRNMITSSQYVVHLGDHKLFWDKMDRHIEVIPKTRRIFLCDGASWIWNRIEDSYSESIQIVDFYHAKERLSQVAEPVLRDQKKQWLSQQEERLLANDVEGIVKELHGLAKKYPRHNKDFKREAAYFSRHTQRMQYGSFRKKGYLIGSGPIESAHRKVIQQRLKLSGQRWTKEGLQTIANLRATYLSGEWGLVEGLINKTV